MQLWCLHESTLKTGITISEDDFKRNRWRIARGQAINVGLNPTRRMWNPPNFNFLWPPDRFVRDTKEPSNIEVHHKRSTISLHSRIVKLNLNKNLTYEALNRWVLVSKIFWHSSQSKPSKLYEPQHTILNSGHIFPGDCCSYHSRHSNYFYQCCTLFLLLTNPIILPLCGKQRN